MDTDNGESGGLGYICNLLSSPVTFWILIILTLQLIERFHLGPHIFTWRRRRSLSTEPWTNVTCDFIDGQGLQSNGVGHAQYSANEKTAPSVFQKFIQTKLIPTFCKQCKNKDDKFAVLVFSQINSLHEIKKLIFKQITFNGKPLVDSRQTTYPEKYRLENYIVAQSSQTEHPEALIAKQVPALLAAFRKSERCHIHNPTPKFGILYSWEMPCPECSKSIIKSLAGVCRRKVVLAYSQESTGEGKENVKRLTDAGITVVKINN